MQSRSPIETPVEAGEEVMSCLLRAVSHLSEGDCGSVLFLQKYHETLFTYGLEIPKIRMGSKSIVSVMS